MASKPENNEKTQNYVELTENQIFEKIKKDLNPIQENLVAKKITVEEAKSELKKINEWLQWTKLDNKDKKEIWKAFEKLIKLEKNTDENTLKNEVNEIINLVETLTKKDLASLKRWIQKNKQRRNPERPHEVQEWIEKSNKNFRDQFAYAAEHEQNPISKRAAKIINNILKDDLA